MKHYSYILLALTLLPPFYPVSADTQKQRQLHREIKQVSSSLNAQKDAYDGLQGEVTALEKKLGVISQKSYETEKKIDATVAKLKDANQQKLKLDAALEAQKAGLAQQLQALYTAGEQSPLRLLLKQDEPSDLSRTVRYFTYLNDSRVQRIQSIRGTLKKIEKIQGEMEKDQFDLNSLIKTLSLQKADIQETLQARSRAVDKIKTDIRFKEKRLAKLRDEESDMQAMLDRLAQRPDPAPPARSPAPSPKAESPARKAKPPAKDDKPAPAVETRFTPDKPFSTLRGRLSWPVSGKIIHSYGSKRNEKQRWKGVVISAAGGSKVRAVAKGRIAFSGWMNGFGYVIIIEHDRQYMSLYGYNRAVYKHEGQTVNANETIAAVGNSSGQSQDGLYFEIRRGSAPENPARWCR